jgi:hypothetical protein
MYHEILSCEPDPSNNGFSRKLRDCSRPREFASRRINDRAFEGGKLLPRTAVSALQLAAVAQAASLVGC